jgi:F420-non-reducing hydrogenase small subunit
MNGKPKLALYWACSCGGCDVALLDTGAKILELAGRYEIVLWPILVDAKEHSVEGMADASIDLCLFNGAIKNENDERMARLLRAKSKVLVSLGACSQLGGVLGLANLTRTAEMLETVYLKAPGLDNPEGTLPMKRTKVPEGELGLPGLLEKVRGLPAVVPVDYVVPGCPPEPARLVEVIDALLAGNLPPKGAVLGASEKALCSTCTRQRRGLKVERFTRRYRLDAPDENLCFLEQGLLCLGPVTRSGCGEACLKSNMPCRGCYGPTSGVLDAGGAMVGVLASLMAQDSPEAVAEAVAGLDDPAGMNYLFSVASSLLREAR